MSTLTLPAVSAGLEPKPHRPRAKRERRSYIKGPYRWSETSETGLWKREHMNTGSVKYVLRFRDGGRNARDVTLQAPTLQDARVEVAAIRIQTATGTRLEPSKMTCAELWDSSREEWLALVAAGERKQRSMENTEALLRKWAWPVLEHRRAQDVKPSHVAEVLARARKAGLSSWTTRDVMKAMSGLFRHGVEQGVLQTNPVQRLGRTVKPKAVDQKTTYAMSTQEIDRVLALVPEGHRTLLTVLADTGLREAEGRGLTWGCVDFAANRLNIDAQLGRDGVRLESLKTASSRRRVPMTGRVRKLLLELRLASNDTSDDALVFAGKNGKGITHIAAYRAVTRAVAKAGIEHGDDRLALHALRHSWISRLVASGVDIVTVSKMAGHSRVSMTLDRYGHLISQKGEGDALLETVERGLAGALS